MSTDEPVEQTSNGGGNGIVVTLFVIMFVIFGAAFAVTNKRLTDDINARQKQDSAQITVNRKQITINAGVIAEQQHQLRKQCTDQQDTWDTLARQIDVMLRQQIITTNQSAALRAELHARPLCGG